MRLGLVQHEQRNGLKQEPVFAINESLYAFAQAAAAIGVDRPGFDGIESLIVAGPNAWKQAAEIVATTGDRIARGDTSGLEPLSDGALVAPIPRPRKNVFCVGRNYAEHAAERGADVPEYPMYFTKPPTAIAGPNEQVRLPHQTEAFDYEGELAVIIGTKGRDIPKERALTHVFGYTILNDLTARDLQKKHVQFFKGKSLDQSCPIGPLIVTPDELEPLWPLTIETRVNGELRQQAPTSLMLFDIPTLIENLSAGMTLEPGDIIATGTPAGVGAADGRYLKRGDRIDITITGIGTLTNQIV